MSPAEPWKRYHRSRLPRGYAYPLGRDLVEQALRQAGARVGWLSFGPPGPESRALSDAMVFDVYWVGDGRSAHGLYEAAHDRLLMRWHAVPSTSRRLLADELARDWLPRASAWAAAAPRRGNVWCATDHRWMVVSSGTALRLVEDGPGLG